MLPYSDFFFSFLLRSFRSFVEERISRLTSILFSNPENDVRRARYLYSRGGFTLIELLTVIAIIGILASILIPVVGKVRESAKQSVCTSNVRQIGLAMILFATENERLPTLASNGNPEFETDWILWRRGQDPRDSVIAPYVGEAIDAKLFRCPSDTNYLARTYRYSYAMNTFLGANADAVVGNGPTIGGNLEMVEDPSRIILLAEEDSPDDGHFSYTTNEIGLRHGGKGSVTFCDGSTQVMGRNELLDARNRRDPTRFDPLYRGN